MHGTAATSLSRPVRQCQLLLLILQIFLSKGKVRLQTRQCKGCHALLDTPDLSKTQSIVGVSISYCKYTQQHKWGLLLEMFSDFDNPWKHLKGNSRGTFARL